MNMLKHLYIYEAIYLNDGYLIEQYPVIYENTNSVWYEKNNNLTALSTLFIKDQIKPTDCQYYNIFCWNPIDKEVLNQGRIVMDREVVQKQKDACRKDLRTALKFARDYYSKDMLTLLVQDMLNELQ